MPNTAGLARPPHLGSCRALWHALDGGAHSQRPSGSCGPRLGSPPRLTKLQLLRGLGPPRRPNGAGEGAHKGAHKVRPHDGADAQPLYQQGRGCGAGLAAQRQSFLACTPGRYSVSNGHVPPHRGKWQLQPSSFSGQKPRIRP